MTVKELEQRVAVLERQVQQLTGELRAASAKRRKDPIGAIRKFAGDEGLLSMLAGAQKLREKDRERARRRRAATKPKP